MSRRGTEGRQNIGNRSSCHATVGLGSSTRGCNVTQTGPWVNNSGAGFCDPQDLDVEWFESAPVSMKRTLLLQTVLLSAAQITFAIQAPTNLIHFSGDQSVILHWDRITNGN